MIILLLILTGIAVGLLSSFFGIGGGVLMVPILYSLFPEMAPETIIATSIGTIFINTITNLTNFYRLKKFPNWRLVIWLAAGLSLGIIAASNSLGFFSPKVLKYIFAGLLLVIALKSLISKTATASNDPNWQWRPNGLIQLKALVLSLFGGILSGLTGLGGGAITIPILISVVKMPTRWLSPYTNAAVFFAALSGVISFMIQKSPVCQVELFCDWQVGHVNWGIILCLVSGAFVSSRYGAKLTEIVPANMTKWLFSALLLVLALKLFLTA